MRIAMMTFCKMQLLHQRVGLHVTQVGKIKMGIMRRIDKLMLDSVTHL